MAGTGRYIEMLCNELGTSNDKEGLETESQVGGFYVDLFATEEGNRTENRN